MRPASHCQPHTSPITVRQPAAGDLLPTRAAVSGFVDRARSRGRSIRTPRRTLVMQKRSIDGLRIVRIGSEFDRANILVLIQNLLPVRAAIDRAEYPALRVGAISIAERRTQPVVRIMSIGHPPRNVA